MNNYAIAKSYHDAGYTIVPLRCDGSKSPLIEWKERNWSSLERYFVATAGIGILCGHRSGGWKCWIMTSPKRMTSGIHC